MAQACSCRLCQLQRSTCRCSLSSKQIVRQGPCQQLSHMSSPLPYHP